MVENVPKECCKDKILSFFEGKLSKLTNDFFRSPHSYLDCIVLWCSIQDKIVFEGTTTRVSNFLFLKVHMNFDFFFNWNFIGASLDRTTIDYHSTLSYHVPFHYMLKWIILTQNLLYNCIKWRLYIWLEPFEFFIFFKFLLHASFEIFFFFPIRSLLCFSFLFFFFFCEQHSYPFFSFLLV